MVVSIYFPVYTKAMESCGRTYEAKGEDEERADSMRKHAQTKNWEMLECDHQVPEKVSHCKALDQAGCSSVTPHLLFPTHVLPLIVREHDIEGEGIDQRRLDERNNMNIPVQLGSLIEALIDRAEEIAGEGGRNVPVDDMVKSERNRDLVDV